MGDSSKYPSIIKYMMLEEIRMQASMIGKFQFIFFSVFIGIFAFILAVLSPLILETTSMREIYFLIHLIIIAYGMGVGAFGLFADQIMERRFGEVNFLITTPSTQPMSFRTAFLAFYVKDVIYYLSCSVSRSRSSSPPCTCAGRLSVVLSLWRLLQRSSAVS
jgi:sugar phosphate permease